MTATPTRIGARIPRTKQLTAIEKTTLPGLTVTADDLRAWYLGEGTDREQRLRAEALHRWIPADLAEWARLTLHKSGPIAAAAARFARRPVGKGFAEEVDGHLERLDAVKGRAYAAQTRRFRLTGMLDDY